MKVTVLCPLAKRNEEFKSISKHQQKCIKIRNKDLELNMTELELFSKPTLNDFFTYFLH